MTKLAKRAFLAIALAGVVVTTVVNAQGFVTESAYSGLFVEMRPTVAKLGAKNKKKAMAMEAATMKVKGDHHMAITKSTLEQRLATF